MKIIFLSIILVTFCYGSVFAIEPVTDANSINKLIQQIDALADAKLFNLTFKSKIDNTFQPMLVKIPEGYKRTESWPLLVVLHGLGDGPIIVPSINSMVQIGPFGRGDMWYQDIGEQDVFECIELAKKIFNIDSDRIYLSGFSMGGAGTFKLGLKHPDTWAACVPVCGRMNNLDMVSNGSNLPFWINTGSEDMVVPAKYSQRAYETAIELGFKHWKYTEYEQMGHSFWIDWRRIEKWLLTKKRNNSPSTVSFTSDKPDRAYWAQINKKNKYPEQARIDVEINSQTINIKISKVTEYTLYLNDAPVNLSCELTIIENNKQIFQGHLSCDGTFNRKLETCKTCKILTK